MSKVQREQMRPVQERPPWEGSFGLGNILYIRAICGMEKKERIRPLSGKPIMDVRYCSDCESCLSICPSVFLRNRDTGLIEVMELDEYPEEEIREAINCCPEDCIALEGSG
jgi:ferredoxin